MVDFLAPKLDTAPEDKAAAYSLVEPIASPDDVSIGDKMGLSPDLVSRNKDAILKDQNKKMLEGIFKQNPKAKAWVNEDPSNAALVSDDPTFLGDVARFFKSSKGAFVGGAVNTKIFDLRAMENFTDLTPEQQAQLAEYKAMPETQQDYTEGNVASAFVKTGLNTLPQLVVQAQGAAMGAAPGAAVGFAVGNMPGMVTGASFGATGGAAVTNFMQMSGQIRDDLLSVRGVNGEQLDPNVVRGASVASGAFNAGLEFMPFGVVVKNIPGVNKLFEAALLAPLKKGLERIPGFEKIADPFTKEGMRKVLQLPGAQQLFYNFGKRVSEITATETVTEAGQQGVQIGATEGAKAASEGEFTPITFEEATKQIGKAAYGGALGGGFIGAGMASINVPLDAKRQRAFAEDAMAQAATINEGVRARADVLSRSPERMHRLFQMIAEDERFYIAAEPAIAAINALPPEQQQALFAAVPDLQLELTQAATTGADIAIKKADYAAFIAPYPQADTLAEHMKLDPADQSVFERNQIAEAMKQAPELVNELRREMTGEKPVSAKEMYPAIQRMVSKAMQAVGRDRKESEAVGTLYSRYLARMAAPFGQNAVNQLTESLLEFQALDEQGQPVLKKSNIGVMLDDLQKMREGKPMPGVDAQMKGALRVFADRMEKAGIKPEDAVKMGDRELLDAVYPQGKPDEEYMQEGIQTLLEQQITAPGVEMTGQQGQLNINLSAATDTISGIKTIKDQALAGDTTAHVALQQIASNMLRRLTAGLGSVKIKEDRNTGLYGGEVEPSLGITVDFDEAERPAVLAALAQFAQNFNQQQVHVRQPSDGQVGEVNPDGSFNTPVFTFGLSRPLTRQEVEAIIAQTGLPGMTFNDNKVEIYYADDPNDDAGRQQWLSGARAAQQAIASLGANGGDVQARVERLWIYGEGSGAIPYEQIAGDVRAGQGPDENARLIGERYFGGPVNPAQQAKYQQGLHDGVAKDQAALQRRIAAEYEALPDNDMGNPIVRQAYEELVKETIEQYRALPLREVVALVKRDENGNVVRDENGDAVTQGEPYKNSDEMRHDVSVKNRMTFFPTTKQSFGPAGVDFSGHPLLSETEFRDKNGYPMLANDLFRVIHDYYAHTLSETTFGPLGEEAAWKNHMATIKSPLAKWALTTETRGQNSWVNFNRDVYNVKTIFGKNIPLTQRHFARQKAALLPIEYVLTGDEKVDQGVNELMASIPAEQHNGSLKAEQRVNPDQFIDVQEPVTQLFQIGEAQRNGIGLYSAVEKNIIEMNLPAWKKSPKPLLTDEQRAELEVLNKEVTSTSDERYPRRLELAALARKEIGVAKGGDIWQKVEKLPVKKEEIEWLGLQEYLTADPNETFTREEVVDFIRNNGVEIKEVYADSEATTGDFDWQQEVIDDPDYVRSEAEYFKSEMKADGDFSAEWLEIVYDVMSANLSEMPLEIEKKYHNNKDDGEVIQWVVDNLSDEIDEKVEEAALERAQSNYDDNPYYRWYDRETDYEITGNDDIGYSITTPDGRALGGGIYSFSEAEIRAREHAVNNGYMTSEDDPTVAKWGEYVTKGAHDNYRERKLTLPKHDEDFYYDTHFNDRNILAFLRETDRMLASEAKARQIEETLPKEVPDNMTINNYKVRPTIAAAKEHLARIEKPEYKEHLRAEAEAAIRAMYDRNGKSINEEQAALRESIIADPSKWEDAVAAIEGRFGDTMQPVRDYLGLEDEIADTKYDIGRAQDDWEKMGRREMAMRDARVETFFIDEFQSDWHQQGRKVGYAKGEEDAGDLEEQSKALIERAMAAYANVVAQYASGPLFDEKTNSGVAAIEFIHDMRKQAIERLRREADENTDAYEGYLREVRAMATYLENAKGFNFLNSLASGDYKKDYNKDDMELFNPSVVNIALSNFAKIDGGKEVLNYIKASITAKEQASAERYGVPDVPFKDDGWLSLGLKRAIVDAVEKGYGRFAWADAQVLSNRWSDKYKELYENQYDKKMPSIVKRLTGTEPKHVESAKDLRGEGYWYIDITPELVEKVRNESFALFQRERGYIQFEEGLRKVVIAFTSGANLSTAAHEFAHFGVAMHRQFAQLARQQAQLGEVVPEVQRIIDDWEKLKKFVGATGDVFTVEQEERLARQFEAYLREGVAPSEDLRPIFTRFREWFSKIYRDLKSLLGENEQIDPEVSAVFDRWLASEDEIEKTRGKNDALAQIAQNLGLDPNITMKVAAYVNSATNEAEEKIYKELKKEQEKRETEAYKRELEAMKKTVSEEMIQRREYALVKYMKDMGFRFLDGIGLEGISTDLLTEEDNEKTVLPDDVAELFGYGSGQEMLRTLKKLPELDRAADAEARRRLMTKYPDMIVQGKIQNRAVDAIMNDKVLAALDLMIKELGKSSSMKVTPVSMKAFARVMAQQTVQNMKQADTGYAFRYDVARDKAMREALKASRAGDPQRAMIELQKAMVNQIVFKQLEDFNEFKEEANRLFAKVNGKDKDLAGARDIDFLGAARYLLSMFGLGKSDPSFNAQEWLQDLNERHQDIAQDIIGLTQIIGTQPKPADQLTVAEFTDLYNSVENIYHVARTAKEIQIAGRKMKTEQAVAETTANIDAEKVPLNSSTQLIGINKFKQNLSTLKASLRRVESWTKAMDGGDNGPMWKNVWRPINDAVDTYIDERNMWMKRLRETIKPYDKRLSERKKIATGMFKKDSLGRTTELVFDDAMQMIGFMLHTGNESNLDKLLGGYGIERALYEQQIRELEKKGIIKKEDWELVQKLWDLAEDLKPISQKAHKNLYGFRFEEIDPTPVESLHGTFRGGYWPAIVDSDQTTEGKTLEQMLEQGRQYMLATTGKGFTKGRKAGYRQPLKTDLRLASQHIDKVLKFSYIEPAVRDVWRIVNNHEFKSKIEAVDPSAYSEMLVPWLQRAATQTTAPIAISRSERMGSKIVNFLQGSASRQLMGYNIVVAVQNFANLPVAAHLVGKTEFMRAFVKQTISPLKMHKEMIEASKQMRDRLSINDVRLAHELEQISNRSGKAKKGYDTVVRNSRVFMLGVDTYLSGIVWTAGYNKAQKQGLTHNDAVAYADKVIRDSMGANNAKDISSLEASSPVVKALTPFYSFFAAQSNLVTTEFGNIMRKHGWAGSGKMFMTYLSLIAGPAVIGQFIVDSLRGNLPDDEDEDGEVLDDWIAWAMKSQLKYLTAMVPFFGQAANAVVNAFDDNPMNDRLSISPIVSAGEAVVGTVKNVGRAMSGDDINDGRLLKDAAMGLGFVTGLPLGQPVKPLAYGVAVSQGEVEAEDAIDIAQGLLTGKTTER